MTKGHTDRTFDDALSHHDVASKSFLPGNAVNDRALARPINPNVDQRRYIDFLMRAKQVRQRRTMLPASGMADQNEMLLRIGGDTGTPTSRSQSKTILQTDSETHETVSGMDNIDSPHSHWPDREPTVAEIDRSTSVELTLGQAYEAARKVAEEDQTNFDYGEFEERFIYPMTEVLLNALRPRGTTGAIWMHEEFAFIFPEGEAGDQAGVAFKAEFAVPV